MLIQEHPEADGLVVEVGEEARLAPLANRAPGQLERALGGRVPPRPVEQLVVEQVEEPLVVEPAGVVRAIRERKVPGLQGHGPEATHPSAPPDAGPWERVPARLVRGRTGA